MLSITHLKLNLKKWRQVYQGHLHVPFDAFKFNDIVKIAAEAVVQIVALLGYVDVEMREEVFLFVYGVAREAVLRRS